MQYVFKCSAQGCNFSVKVETENSNWVIGKITAVSLFHRNHTDPKMTPLTAEQIRTLVVPNIKEDKMNFYDEVKKVATELYEKNGRMEGRDLDNWLDAERILTAQYKEHEKLEAQIASHEGKAKKAHKEVNQKRTTKPKRKNRETS